MNLFYVEIEDEKNANFFFIFAAAADQIGEWQNSAPDYSA